jgi:hypothetical protein
LERLWGHPQADIHAGEWGEQIIPSTRRLMTSFPCFRPTHVETRNGIAVRLRTRTVVDPRFRVDPHLQIRIAIDPVEILVVRPWDDVRPPPTEVPTGARKQPARTPAGPRDNRQLYEITPETQHALGGWDSSKAHSCSSAVGHYLDLSRPRDPNRYTSSRLDLAPRTRPCWHGQRKPSR